MLWGPCLTGLGYGDSRVGDSRVGDRRVGNRARSAGEQLIDGSEIVGEHDRVANKRVEFRAFE